MILSEYDQVTDFTVGRCRTKWQNNPAFCSPFWESQRVKALRFIVPATFGEIPSVIEGVGQWLYAG